MLSTLLMASYVLYLVLMSAKSLGIHHQSQLATHSFSSVLGKCCNKSHLNEKLTCFSRHGHKSLITICSPWRESKKELWSKYPEGEQNNLPLKAEKVLNKQTPSVLSSDAEIAKKLNKSNSTAVKMIFEYHADTNEFI